MAERMAIALTKKKPRTLMVQWTFDIHWRNLYGTGLLLYVIMAIVMPKPDGTTF